MKKNILIVQFRTDQSKLHEQTCYTEDLEHMKDRIYFHDAITTPFPKDLSEIAGVILGGSGEFMLGEGHGVGSWRDATMDFLDTLLEKDIPTLGICFGSQLIAIHQGGELVQDEAMRETGTYAVHISDTGTVDPLMKGISSSFKTIFGHKETMINLPDHIETLATTDRTPHNTFRIKGKRVWATLGHPELTPERLEYRLSLWPGYRTADTAVEHEATPEAVRIIHNFIDIVDDVV